MFRVGIVLSLCLLAAACRGREPEGPSLETRSPGDLAARFLAPDGWAWGALQVGSAPVQRYGVVSTRRAPRADILILPGYGESAETWFETARDLTARGYTVWILERAGQGGSARFSEPRDRGDAPSFDPDVAAVRALAGTVVRPAASRPFVILAAEDAAPVAILALGRGTAADGLILTSPRLRDPQSDQVPPRWSPWSRSGPDDLTLGRTHDPWRGAVNHAWQTANPDLRMGAPGARWLAAASAAAVQAAKAGAGLSVSTLVLTPGDASARVRSLCAEMARCRLQVVSGARAALHLEADRWRRPWSQAVAAFIGSKVETARSVRSLKPATPSQTRDGSEDERLS